MSIDREDRLAGALLGMAVGDALGLPREGLSRRRAERMFGTSPLRHRFLLGRGMVSDDTEHACMTAQALLASNAEPRPLARSLAWRLRGWLLGVPAGIGFGTLRAILKLWIGFPPHLSGVHSSGNGPAMRSPLLGAALAHREDALDAAVQASTRVTHRDARAEAAATAIARAAAHASRSESLDGPALLDALARSSPQEELAHLLGRAALSLRTGHSTAAFADALGLSRGISGYALHTVPVALHAWLAHARDFGAAVEEVIRLGGDADTTGAIVGGLAGASLGARAIPAEWLEGLLEWPRSVGWMRRLAHRLALQFPASDPPQRQKPLPLFWPGLALRNPFMIAVVLLHGFRRALPPY